jgi:hypothetical protein
LLAVDMIRKPRVHFPGAFYYVIARGNREIGDIRFINGVEFRRFFFHLVNSSCKRTEVSQKLEIDKIINLSRMKIYPVKCLPCEMFTP